jgi:hypothetical protein
MVVVMDAKLSFFCKHVNAPHPRPTIASFSQLMMAASASNSSRHSPYGGRRRSLAGNNAGGTRIPTSGGGAYL